MSVSGYNILNQTYRCTKLSPTTCDLYASSVSTFFPSSVLHTKLCRRLSRFVTAFDGASSPSTMASAKVRASDSRLCAPFSSTSFTPSMSMRRQYKSRLGHTKRKKILGLALLTQHRKTCLLPLYRSLDTCIVDHPREQCRSELNLERI